MAEGGYDEHDPLLDHTDDHNDGSDDGDTTGTFQPAAPSSRRPSSEQIPMRTTTTNRPSERGGTAETSFIKGQGNLTRQFRLDDAQKKIKYHFPNYNKNIDLSFDASDKIVAKSQTGKDIPVFKVDNESLLANFVNKFVKTKALGLSREAYLDQLKKGERDRKKFIANQQKILDDTYEDSGKKALAEKGIKKAQLGIERIEKRISEVGRQTLQSPTGVPEAITLEDFTQHEEQRDERQQEIQRERQEQEEIVRDENRPQAEREQARENLEGLDQQVNEIVNEREREIEQLPLRERLREKDTAHVMTILQGHYTLESIARELQNVFAKYDVELPTEINTPVGQLIISNPQARKIILDRDLARLLGITRRLQLRTFVKQLTIPTSYFIYCDLVDKDRNFFNGKPTSLLAKFDIRGKAFEKVHYQTPPHVLRDASSDEFVNSLTLSVKDLNSELFDFNGRPLEFEIEIN
ncbi:hypothetical protein OS493_000387 [Desmophyllum pertusum]|uniref:Uncharacterized protein n=1 Tax=Desmophyllum pertusum TaxID=174260 RepID=A0A9X0A799_9CNID|nr:hypothetical protein OS493_000387 [Desmophyllum pertusum]